MNLIVGGNGTIGSYLSKLWIEKKVDFHSSTRLKSKKRNDKPLIDLINKKTLNLSFSYDSAVICAGAANINECQKNPTETRKINVEGTIYLLKELLKTHTHIVFLSSNSVFDGTYPMQEPNSPRNPRTEYGKQKAEVEVFLDNVSNACILRLTKVIHPDLELIKKCKNNLSSGQSISAFTDMTLSPISIYDVISKIDLLISEKSTGRHQLSGVIDISYFDFIRLFAQENGFPPDLIKKGSWRDKLDFKPPNFTSLVNT